MIESQKRLVQRKVELRGWNANGTPQWRDIIAVVLASPFKNLLCGLNLNNIEFTVTIIQVL